MGRTPRSARVPLDPLFLIRQQADEGVGRGPGVRPTQSSTIAALSGPEATAARCGTTAGSRRTKNSPPRPFWLLSQFGPDSVPCWFMSPKMT